MHNQSEAQSLSQAIYQRIGVRERMILQFEFLSRFFASPESEGFVLCGSAALHGAYLQRRWSKDLDFLAPIHLADSFPAIADRCGLPLKMFDVSPIFPNVISRFYAQSGRIYSEVQIGVEVFPHSKPISFERRILRLSKRHSIETPVQPLAQLAFAKLGCIQKRNKSVDFLDLWFSLLDPEIRRTLRQILIKGECSAGGFTPDVVQCLPLLESLASLGLAWKNDLDAVMVTPPPFERVYHDLSCWLPALENL